MDKKMFQECTFRKLTKEDIPIIASAFTKIGWNKPEQLYKKYLKEQENNTRCVWVAFIKDIFVGYVTLKLNSQYQPFNVIHTPEINDLNVLPEFRKRGIGAKLLELAENEAERRGNLYVGLGVGLSSDYAAAQRLYIKRGYMPDGRGITYKNEQLSYGDTAILDDDLILWCVKKLV